MSLLESLNTFTKNLLGIGIVDAWQQAKLTKEASKKASQLTKTNHLREAVTLAEKSLAFWSKKVAFWERWIIRLLLGNLLNQLNQQLQEWRKQVAIADKLAADAKKLLKQDNGDPWETQVFANAITFYKRCSQILYDERVLQAINQCQQELQKRQQFQGLVQQAQSQAENQFFKNAISTYSQAQQLYSTEAVTQAITEATEQVQHEDVFDSTLQKAQQAETDGRLQGAIALLEAALAKFTRSDGLDLLHKLQSIVKGREIFRQGLAAEKAGYFEAAISFYENAKSLLPDITNCRIRLGLVKIKTQDWATALSYLQGLSCEQAAYLRGFAYAQQNDLQSAVREWQGISSANIVEQREILKNISQRQRLTCIQHIEKLVKAENLEQAQTVSREFLQNFGSNLLVEDNLNQYIQPSLKAAVWQSTDWNFISNKAEKDWLAQPDIITLHNYAIANYYCAQNKSNKISDSIIYLSSALANLNIDPTLIDVPWLENKRVDFVSVSNELKQRVQSAIDILKDTDINNYFKLLDCWRLEKVALELMGQPAMRGVKINDIFVTPGCYNHYISKCQTISVKQIDTNQQLLHCLYTAWGLAVAACISGDSQRAIQLKPATQPTSGFEIFAQKFVAYHEGIYHLQQKKWREAINPLKQAKSEIQANQNWQREIDRLCGLQRQTISEHKEHLDFAQSWYDVLNSQTARSYLAEYKSEEVREKLANNHISKQQALNELEKIKQIDNENPILLDLLERIKIAQAAEAVEVYLKNDNLKGAVTFAKNNEYPSIKYMVAEICMEIFMEGFKTREVGFEGIYELGLWANELCPNNQDVQTIYSIGKELNEIKNLIKCERVDNAIYRAKHSQYDAISSYVADYFIIILLQGIKSQTLSAQNAYQLGRWAYELCPDDPDYQKIYTDLNIR